MAKKKVVRLRRQDQLYVQITVSVVIAIAICFALFKAGSNIPARIAYIDCSPMQKRFFENG